MRVLYADLNNSGISGDMFLASLLGLVPEPDKILNELKELKNYLSGVSLLEIEIKKIFQSGIQLNRLKITIKESKNHRSAKTLKKSLNSYLSDKSFSESAKIFANQVLDSLIRAEAEVHDKLANEIHLHELSSIDTLLDIIGVTTVLERIDFFSENFKIFCSKIPLGGGKVKTAHGILTVPAPATLKILESSNLITYGGPIDSELVTPTGIALLSNLNPEYLEYIPEMTILKTIYSTGQKEFANFLNTLRLFYGETKDNNNIRSPHFMERYVEQISILETDVDDVSGEIIGNLFNKLKNEDILDIQIIPSFTKKNRPSQIIRVLCFPKDVYKLSETM
ncbi:MAG: nickel pincer cofactor biosynthesis protein LarC, partial [Promethearchaeota archaeon]